MAGNPIRQARLQNDYQRLQKLCADSGGRISIVSARGNPPDTYEIKFICRSVERLQNGAPVYRSEHRLHVSLPAHYPGLSGRPYAKFLTTIYHPHVFTNSDVCIGSKHFVSEFLDLFVLRIGEILRYNPDYLDEKSPANPSAMDWAKRSMALFPTDPRPFIGSSDVAKPQMTWTNL